MPFNSRKRQIAELESQLKSLRQEVYMADGNVTERLTSIEAIIEGHDATLDANAKALDDLPAKETLASTDQLEALGRQQETALANERAGFEQLVAQQRELISAQEAKLAVQESTIHALHRRLDELASKTASDAARVEARLGEISEQVLHQVEELSHEVDAATQLAQRAADSAGTGTGAEGALLPDGLLDEIKAAQVKLANEQVRYDLALRSELAELADRLRRSGRS